MISDQPLFDAISFGLMKAEAEMAKLGISHWRVAMVAYDPANPNAYMVIGTRGDEKFQQAIVGLINPDDAGKEARS